MKLPGLATRLFVCLFILSFLTTAADASVSLYEAYQSALQKTEAARIQEARAEQARERLWQARGRLLPNVSFVTSYTLQHSPPDSSNRAFTRPDQISSRVNLSQPLFRGLGEWATLWAAGADVDAQQALVEQAKLSVYVSSAQAFYDVQAAEREVQNLETLIELTLKRVTDLQARSKIGRSREGEVLTAQAQVSVLKAQLQAAEAVLVRTRNVFSAVTGLPVETGLEVASDSPQPPRALADYLELVENRPDIRALRLQLEAAEDRIGASRSGHFPTLDFNTNYYLKRTGVLEKSKWDLGLLFVLPIFQGGVVQSQVRETAERAKEQELLLAQSRRQAQAELKNAHESLNAGLAQLLTLQNALEVSEKNYQTQQKDYRFGLVTNLDVLQALNTFQETKRTLDRVHFQTQFAFAQLQAASGTLGEEKK